VILTYGYDNFNNRTSIQDNSGGTESLTYDSDNNLTNVSLSKSGWSNSNSVTLAYDTANRLTSLIRQWGNKNLGFTQVKTTYGYDNADRLTGISHSIVGGSTLMTLTYGYDNANQLTSYAGPDGSITYGYDTDGQLTGATGTHNETYTYDKEGNRTMTGYVTSIGNRLTSDGTYSYTYDSDGNMLTQTRISDGQVTSYTWDFRNRLTEVLIKTSGGTTVQDDKFTYEIENRRIGKNTLSGGQSWTAYIDANPFMDFNSSGSLLYRYMYGNAIDFLIGRLDPSGNAMWYLTDKLGSVRENTDGSGNVLDSITYDTFGNIIGETHPTSGDRFKYTSREWDSEIGQYFYRARYYSPIAGRFESEDPLGFAADTDLYCYVRNDPTGLEDPAGLEDVPAKVIMGKGDNIPGKYREFSAARKLLLKKEMIDATGQWEWGVKYNFKITNAAGNSIKGVVAAEVVEVVGEPTGFFKDNPNIIMLNQPILQRGPTGEGVDRQTTGWAGNDNDMGREDALALFNMAINKYRNKTSKNTVRQYFVYGGKDDVGQDGKKKGRVIPNSGFEITKEFVPGNPIVLKITVKGQAFPDVGVQAGTAEDTSTHEIPIK
jgi:RHS repeat-associated protein